jgi:uncharacterized protein (DUF488 family)
MSDTLYTVGYGGWPVAKRMQGLIMALSDAGITMLIDVRHSPCASDPTSATNYRAQAWNLQVTGGIEMELAHQGIAYRWLVELGNPQKRDREMRILREQLDSGDLRWPIHRGLQLLDELLADASQRYGILCACADYSLCHRQLIARTVRSRPSNSIARIVDLTPKGPETKYE